MNRHLCVNRISKTLGILIVLLLGVLAFALTPVKVSAESVSTDSWQDLQSKFDTLNNVTITLSDTCKATENDSCLILQQGKNITLDLNGYTLDRNAESSMEEKTDAIKVYGNLTIIDSKDTGRITGARGFDGAIKLAGGSLIMEGGTITENSAWSTAGGVYIYDEGSFTMNGGEIRDNYGESVGGVYVDGGSFKMTGGKIVGNDAYFNNGGVCVRQGSFTMTGGEISENDGHVCAAVLIPEEDLARNAAFVLQGGSIAGGEVVYDYGDQDGYTGSIDISNGSFKLSGGPVISSGDYADIYLADGKTISVTGGLDASRSLSVETAVEPTEDAPVIITDGLKNKGDIFNFSSFKGYGVAETGAGEAMLGVPAINIIYKAGWGTGNDITKKGIKEHTYTLADCQFEPPAGMKFNGWSFFSDPKIYQPGETFSLNSEKRISAQYECIEHEWSVPEYEWAEDYSSLTATRTCPVDEAKETETVPVSLEIDDPTCEEAGLKTWTSEEFENEAFEIQTRTEDLEALDHDWGAWQVTKNANALSSGIEQRVCANDPSHVQKQVIPATGVSGTLMARETTSGSKGLKISWTKIKGAEGYDIFFARCSKNDKKTSCRKIKTIKGNSTFSWTKKGLKKKTAYKVYVKAFAFKDGKKTYIRTSPTMHAFTTGYDKKYTNAKAVKVKKRAVTLRAGGSSAIKASVKKLKSKKKLMIGNHAPKLRYLSSDKKIAVVSSTGKITAKAKGTCIVYVYTHNGISKGIKVTVK